MLFNTPEFFIFLGIVLLLYIHLSHRWQNRMLLVASYLFYSFWDYRFLSLIVLSTAVDYVAGRWIEQARDQHNKKYMRAGLMMSLVVNLGILVVFKYFNFFIDSAELFLSTIGISVAPPLLQVLLPVGISFYTFQTLSYTIDVYRGHLEPAHSWEDFALFVAFFPQLVAGPIERAVNLLPQVQNPRVVTPTHWQEGAYLILIGLLRKVVIADTAGIIADRMFADPTSHSSLELFVGLFLYSLQIYGDFAGYSNIARGTAKLLGFDLMQNFRHPYFAVNVSDFWRRWHISLSTWLRDYLYIPLGGNRRGPKRTYVNLMITMLLGGIWHGANWNFVIWGGLHGLYLVGYRLLQPLLPGRRTPAWTAISMAGTFSLVLITWLFFRSTDFSLTLAYLEGLLQFTVGGKRFLIPMAVLSLLVLAIDVPQAVTDDEFVFLR